MHTSNISSGPPKLGDVETRQDLEKLVRVFYGRIQKDPLLGRIFNKLIIDWKEHFETITNFWEMHLFRTQSYTGDVIKVHQIVDRKEGYSVTMNHFGAWLNLWISTIDNMFQGENANLLKYRARKMGTHLYINIFQKRPTV